MQAFKLMAVSGHKSESNIHSCASKTSENVKGDLKARKKMYSGHGVSVMQDRDSSG